MSTTEISTVSRRPASPFCAVDLGDVALRDVAFGSLGPVLVALAEESSPHRGAVTALLHEVATSGLRCLLADPRRCPTTARLLGHTGGVELVLVHRGVRLRSLDPRTSAAEIVRLVAASLPAGR